MLLARADLELLLRDRKLIPPVALSGNTDEYATAPTGVTALDARLGGGFPRGQLSEIVGARSSGRTSLMLQMLVAATTRCEIVALIDVLDMFDVASAATAGVDLGRLLWVRGQLRAAGGSPGANHAIYPGQDRDMNQRALDRTIKALTLVLQAGNFGLVAFDAAEAPPHALERLPFTTWRRLQRIIEGSQTACVLVGDTPIARSAGGVTVRLTRAEGRGQRVENTGQRAEGTGQRVEGKGLRVEGKGLRVEGRLFKGFDLDVEIVRARAHRQENAAVPLSTHALYL